MKLENLWPLFPFAFVGMWLLVGFQISRKGWSEFAHKYSVSMPPIGERFLCPSARFGNILASYRNVMFVSFSDAGMYVSAMFLFRAFHSPFLVPWKNVVGITTAKRFWVVRNELEVRDDSDCIRVQLTEKATREYERFKRA
jgi:hypothetical protein